MHDILINLQVLNVPHFNLKNMVYFLFSHISGNPLLRIWYELKARRYNLVNLERAEQV